MRSAYAQILNSYFSRSLFWLQSLIFLFVLGIHALILSMGSVSRFDASVLYFGLIGQTIGAIAREQLTREWVLNFPDVRRRHLIVAFGLIGYFLFVLCLVSYRLGASVLNYGSVVALSLALCLAAGYRPSNKYILLCLLWFGAIFFYFMRSAGGDSTIIRFFMEGAYPAVAFGLLVLSGCLLWDVARSILQLTAESPEFRFKDMHSAMLSGTVTRDGRGFWLEGLLDKFGRDGERNFGGLEKYSEQASVWKRERHWRIGLQTGQAVSLLVVLVIGGLILFMGVIKEDSSYLRRFIWSLGIPMFLSYIPQMYVFSVLLQKLRSFSREMALPISRDQYVRDAAALLGFAALQGWLAGLALLLALMEFSDTRALLDPMILGNLLLSLALLLLGVAVQALIAYYARRSIQTFQTMTFVVLFLFLTGPNGVVSSLIKLVTKSAIVLDDLPGQAALAIACLALAWFVARVTCRKWQTADV